MYNEDWESIIPGKFPPNAAWEELYSIQIPHDTTLDIVFVGKNPSGKWQVNWTGYGPDFMPIEASNVDEAKAEAIALWRMR